MIEVYENDNRMIDLSKLPETKPVLEPNHDEELRRKARELKRSILESKKAAS